MSYDRRSSIHERVRVKKCAAAEKNTRFYIKKTIKTAFLSVQPQKKIRLRRAFFNFFF